MQNFLLEYGLLAIFLCALVENDIIFIMTGVVIHLGIVHPGSAFTACMLGSIIHDTIWFAVGHARSAAIRNSAIYRRVGPSVEKLAARFGPWELFFCRFIYGTRYPSLVFWGIHRLSIPRFIFIECAAFTIWGGALCFLGYILSDSVETVIGHVKSIEHFLLGVLILALLCFLGMRLFTRHEMKKLMPPPPRE